MAKTIAQLKTLTKDDIHDKSTPKSVLHATLANDLDFIIDEIANRGFQYSVDVAGLATTTPVNGILVLVPGIGLFKALVTASAADDITTFAGPVAGTLWQLINRSSVTKKYVALLTQAAAGAPTATVLGSNGIGTIVWARSAAGIYTGTLVAAFTVSKTALKIQNNVSKNNAYSIVRTSADVVTINTAVLAAGPVETDTDSLLTGTLVEIEVYP